MKYRMILFAWLFPVTIFSQTISISTNEKGEISLSLIYENSCDIKIQNNIVSGIFSIDSIFEMDEAYRIVATSIDSLWSNNVLLFYGIPDSIKYSFTIISFKDGEKHENEIHCGGIYRLTLCPHDGAWVVYGDKWEDWNSFQTVKHQLGKITSVPYPLIYTQLMEANELSGLGYIPNQ